MLRVGCYVRVSTEEQAMHGFSIETQRDNLKSFCAVREMKIVDFYADEGISGAKPPMKRPALKRLLDDVQDGKIDLILFTKLDRWFRSVSEYFKVQEILDRKKVEWKAIHEDYDTTTANGRMAITIFLAIAQNEREKTSERIKVVLEHKRQNKEVCFGNTPFGYMKAADENGIMRLVKNPETEPMVNAFIQNLYKHQSVSKAVKITNEEYGLSRSLKCWEKIIHNEIYCGRYFGVDGYCDAYISVEEWESFQGSKRKFVRSNGSDAVYIFAGMIRCPQCGCIMAGTYNASRCKSGIKKYKNYRCWKKYFKCIGSPEISEKKIEKQLLKNLRSMIETEIESVEVEESQIKAKPKNELKNLKEKLRRLNVSYIDGNMTDDEYRKRSAAIKKEIEEAEEIKEPPKRDLKVIKELLETDFNALYAGLSEEDKRRFWRSIITEIRFNDSDVIGVTFV